MSQRLPLEGSSSKTNAERNIRSPWLSSAPSATGKKRKDTDLAGPSSETTQSKHARTGGMFRLPRERLDELRRQNLPSKPPASLILGPNSSRPRPLNARDVVKPSRHTIPKSRPSGASTRKPEVRRRPSSPEAIEISSDSDSLPDVRTLSSPSVPRTKRPSLGSQFPKASTSMSTAGSSKASGSNSKAIQEKSVAPAIIRLLDVEVIEISDSDDEVSLPPKAKPAPLRQSQSRESVRTSGEGVPTASSIASSPTLPSGFSSSPLVARRGEGGMSGSSQVHGHLHSQSPSRLDLLFDTLPTKPGVAEKLSAKIKNRGPLLAKSSAPASSSSHASVFRPKSPKIRSVTPPARRAGPPSNDGSPVGRNPTKAPQSLEFAPGPELAPGPESHDGELDETPPPLPLRNPIFHPDPDDESDSVSKLTNMIKVMSSPSQSQHSGERKRRDNNLSARIPSLPDIPQVEHQLGASSEEEDVIRVPTDVNDTMEDKVDIADKDEAMDEDYHAPVEDLQHLPFASAMSTSTEQTTTTVTAGHVIKETLLTKRSMAVRPKRSAKARDQPLPPPRPRRANRTEDSDEDMYSNSDSETSPRTDNQTVAGTVVTQSTKTVETRMDIDAPSAGPSKVVSTTKVMKSSRIWRQAPNRSQPVVRSLKALYEERGMPWYSEFEDRSLPPDQIDHKLANFMQDTTGVTPALQKDIFLSQISRAEGGLTRPPIEIVNNIDPEVEPCPPWEFEWTSRMLYGQGVPKLDRDVKGCGCVGPCDPTSRTCSCVLRQEFYTSGIDGHGFVYNQYGQMEYPHAAVFECNEACGCTEDCQNRVVQRGLQTKIVLKKTKKKGWGVFAGEEIILGKFVGVYAGELLSEQEAQTRGQLYNAVGRTYLLDVDPHHLKEGLDHNRPLERNRLESWTPKYVVDAFHAGNHTRFLNHSCEPNVAMYPVYTSDNDLEKPLLCAFTTEHVSKGKELCFSYHNEDEDDDPLDAPTQRKRGRAKRPKPKFQGEEALVRGTCHCGTASCTGYLFRMAIGEDDGSDETRRSSSASA